ncbi:MAG: hypothetical protein FJW23_09800 [Acidimicrobiia bacterium]|nr:hypothetical protein [Acidimicrobiia bacterium]
MPFWGTGSVPATHGPRGPWFALACVAALWAAVAAWSGGAGAQGVGGGGSVHGRVTAEGGEVRAFRVRARDAASRISYTVFTNNGRYEIFNLPAATYELQVVEDNVESRPRTIAVEAGSSVGADLAVRIRPAPADAELVEFDELYPPSPARDVMLETCFPCHSSAGKGHLGRATSAWHRLGPRTEEQWRTAVDRMFRRPSGFPLVSDAMVPPPQKEAIVQYLTRLFGPGSTQRDLKLDPLVRDEEALSKAVYVQYELPASYNIHDAYPSSVTPGRVWVSGTLGAVVAIDTRNPDFIDRVKAWRIPPPDDRVFVHGIVEDRGRVFWTEIAGEHIGELNPATDDLTRYPVPTRGAWQHTLRADSQGNVWFSNFTSASRIGVLTSSKEVVEYDALEGWRVPGWNGYGLTVDQQDRVWAVGLSTPGIGMYDPKRDSWKLYPISSGARRLAVDSKGIVWACQHFGNALSRIDPASGAVTEFPMPLKYGSAYEVWPDAEDNLWVTNDVYNSLVRFDQQARRYTYVPYPDLVAHAPKLELAEDGTLWFGMKVGMEPDAGYASAPGNAGAAVPREISQWKLTAFRMHGNVPRTASPREAQ